MDVLRPAWQSARTVSRKPLIALSSLILASVLLAFIASRAEAQAVDWLVNPSDTGFDPTAAGGKIVYEMRVTNDGIQTAPATTVNLTIPALTEFTGATGTITGCTLTPATGPATVVCNVPSLPLDGLASLTVSLRTTQLGTVVFAASLPTAGDDVTTNNSASQARP